MKVTLHGADDVNHMLKKIAPREAKNIMRATVHSIAGSIRDDAKSVMPSDEGDMEDGTKIKRERSILGKAKSTVRVAGAYYWRFLEYGQGPDGVEHGMFFYAVEKYRANWEKTFTELFGKKWEAALKRAAKRNGN